MSPGKARLLTGISCVGTLVVLSCMALLFDVAKVIFPASPAGPVVEFVNLLMLFVGIAGVMLSFDFIGGVLIPTACEDTSPNVWFWFQGWFRSVAIQVLFYSVSFFFYLQIGREVGAAWLIAMFAALQVMLLAGQQIIWQMTTANHSDRSRGISSFVRHSDQRFAGGITGLPGFESILIPNGWRDRLKPSYLKLLVSRRRAAVTSGLRSRGIVIAMLWNTGSFATAILAGGGVVNSVAELVIIFCWFLLFSFVGLLILPTFNRRGVFALDRQVAVDFNAVEMQQAILDVDIMTEQDPDRSASAESIFQPIPCPKRRKQALVSVGAQSTGSGAWNVARMALFLSWAFGGPLARAVHCNVGRPELWAILPTD